LQWDRAPQLRYKLKDTSVRVLEIAPPSVQTDLLGSDNEPRAMALAEFIEETMTDADEVLVKRAKPLRRSGRKRCLAISGP
jgi:uncharacterized oxidoreductase